MVKHKITPDVSHKEGGVIHILSRRIIVTLPRPTTPTNSSAHFHLLPKFAIRNILTVLFWSVKSYSEQVLGSLRYAHAQKLPEHKHPFQHKSHSQQKTHEDARVVAKNETTIERHS